MLLTQQNINIDFLVQMFSSGGFVALIFLGSPYILLSIISIFKRNLYILTPSLLGFIIIQILNHNTVIESTSSTAAIGYFFAPILQVIIALPIGMIAGVLFENALKSNSEKSEI